MITDADLLQANATLIAGILIFLTIAPFSGKITEHIKGSRLLLAIVYITLSLFALSTTTIFFVGDIPERVLFIAKFSTLAGIVGIMFAIATIMGRLPRAQTTQRG
jgi:hypothetical protein